MQISAGTQTSGDVSGEKVGRPFWSVMIPAFKPSESHLRQAIESVLQQDPGPGQMQIQVLDDCSPDVDVAAMVRNIGSPRVEVFRAPKNLGLTGCWNTCIERARGTWVHLLHHDDYVLLGFYEKLAAAAKRCPEASLLAARSFFINEEQAVWKTSERIPELEQGGRAVERFFYGTPVQCPGVVVKKSFYETHGGFNPELSFVVDCEMWARAIGLAGGVVLSDVLACYRTYGGGTTTRLERTADNIKDLQRLNEIFAARYPQFDRHRALRRTCYRAKQQADFFVKIGNAEAAKVNLEFWNAHATAPMRARRLLGKLARNILRK